MTDPTPDPAHDLTAAEYHDRLAPDPLAERDDLQLELLAIAAVKARLAAREKDVKAALAERMRPGDTARPTLPGEQAAVKLGSVSYSIGRETLKVTDQAAFVAWVDDNYPAEVVIPDPVVRPAFVNRFAIANGCIVGPTGELDVPGLSIDRGAPYLSARVDPNGAGALAAAVAAGTVTAILP